MKHANQDMQPAVNLQVHVDCKGHDKQMQNKN